MSEEEIQSYSLSLSSRRAPLSLCLLPQPRALPAALSLFHCPFLASRLPPVCLHPCTPLPILLWIRHSTREIAPLVGSHCDLLFIFFRLGLSYPFLVHFPNVFQSRLLFHLWTVNRVPIEVDFDKVVVQKGPKKLSSASSTSVASGVSLARN
jgi:hypothetical protein